MKNPCCMHLDFPPVTFRDFPKSGNKFEASKKRLTKMCFEHLRSANKTVSKEKDHTIKGKLLEGIVMLEKVCARVVSQQPGENYSYDKVDRKGHMYFSFGRSYYSNKTNFVSDLDTMTGFSGSPILDISRGKVVGILTYGPFKQKTLSKHYVGDSIAMKINANLLSSALSAQLIKWP